MYNVILENQYGDKIDVWNTDGMKCIDIDRVAGTNAVINETKNATLDGSVINSKRIDSRTIVISIRLFDNIGENRLKLYNIAVLKNYIKLNLVNDVRSVYIEGVVKSIECTPFTQKEKMDITIVCPTPYLNEITEIITEFSNVTKFWNFEFATDEEGIPFGVLSDIIQVEIANSGEVESGLTFVVKAKDQVKNLKIIDMDIGEYLKLNYTMEADEIITISTIDKEKSIISSKDNVKTNLLGNLDLTSTWFKAKVGINKYTYSVESGGANIEVLAGFQNKYLGI